MQPRRLKGRATAVLAGAFLLAVLVAVPSAQAAVTASSITTPSDPSFYIADNDAPTQTFALSGTTTGGTTGDHVDVNCYWGDNVETVAANVAVNGDGSFSVPNADMNGIGGQDQVCRVRAVPAGTTPSDLTPFSGPTVAVGERDTGAIIGGPNDGTTDDYYIYAQQITAADDYLSASACGLDGGYLYDSTFARTTVTWYCNDYLWYRDANPATRSEIQVDGANAYLPRTLAAVNDQGSGFPPLTYTYSLDPHTGDLVITETDPIVKCTDATYPPTSPTCATAVSTGVSDMRTITQDHDGHLVWITDEFESTDGQQHTLDLLWENDNRFQDGNGDSTQLEYEFPGQSSYSMHAQNDTVSLPNAPGTIFIRMHGAADGDQSTGQGAIVYDRPATQATFPYSYSFYQGFELHQTATVPAGGSATFRTAYVQDFTQANVDSLANLATLTFRGCTVPKLKGKKLAAAKHAITSAGCTVGKVKKAFSTKVKKGRVISSKPKTGKKLDYQAKVALTVSKGAKNKK